MLKSFTINIMVTDVNETIMYYKDVLGFEIIKINPVDSDILDFAIVQKDNVMIMFQSKESLNNEYKSFNVDVIIPAFTLYIFVEDIVSYYDDVKDKTSIIKKLYHTKYGMNEFAIIDINKNILVFAEEV